MAVYFFRRSRNGRLSPYKTHGGKPRKAEYDSPIVGPVIELPADHENMSLDALDRLYTVEGKLRDGLLYG